MNFDFLTLPREVLEERMLNAMVRILNCEQYEGFKEMLLGLSNDEFYDDDDTLIRKFIKTGMKLVEDTLRKDMEDITAKPQKPQNQVELR